MKKFDFHRTRAELNRKQTSTIIKCSHLPNQTSNNIQEQSSQSTNNPHFIIRKLCNEIDSKFTEYANCHRTFQFIRSKDIKTEQISQLRNKKINNQQLSHFKPFVQPKESILNPSNERQPAYKKLNSLQSKYQEGVSHKSLLTSLALKRKFRKNILIVINKIKLMKVSFAQIVDRKLLSKCFNEPYRQGKQIFTAVKTNNQGGVFRCIIINNYSTFCYDTTGKTPLIWASIRGFYEILNILLKAGCYVNHQDQFGNNALHYAVKYLHPECFKILLLYFSNIKQKQYSLIAENDKNPLNKNQIQKMKNTLTIFRNLGNSISKLSIQKRIQVFEQQQQHFYKQ